MDWTLELVVVPVSDVDRAKAFYLDKAGFELLVDHSAGPEFRVVQLARPGSGCAIAIGTGIGQMVPGSLQGLDLCVSDIEVARDELVAGARRWARSSAAGTSTPGVDPDRQSYTMFMPFTDPDGNGWLVQEVKRDWRVQPVKIDGAAA